MTKIESSQPHRRIDPIPLGFQTFTAVSKTVRLANQIDLDRHPFQELESQFSLAGSILGVVNLPKTVKNAVRSVKALKNTGSPEEYVKKILHVQQCAEKMARSSFSAFLFLTGSSISRRVLLVMGWTSSTIDLHQAAQNWRESRVPIQYLEKIPLEIKEEAEQRHRISLLKICQVALTALCSLFSLFALALGAPIVSSIALSSLAILSSALSIRILFYSRSPHPFSLL